MMQMPTRRSSDALLYRNNNKIRERCKECLTHAGAFWYPEAYYKTAV